MPARRRQTQATEGEAEGGHVVLVDMLTYQVKGRRAGVPSAQRARKGSLLHLDPALNDIEYLIDLKAIAPNDGQPKKRTTAKVLAAAAGGREDPVTAPENLFDVDAADVTQDTDADDDSDEAPDNSTPADDE